MHVILIGLLLAATVFGQTPTPRPISLDPRAYQWTRAVGSSSASVTGNLSAAGAGKVLTIALCPAGLSVGKYLYVFSGTGTAERAAITARSGSAFGGACTVTITTANAHTGAWRAGSATSGIQEALIAAGAREGNTLPVGSFDTYAPIIMDQAYSLHGQGSGVSLIVPRFTDADVITVSSSGIEGFVSLSDFGIDAPSPMLAGSMISVTNKDKAFIKNIYMRSPWIGIDFSASGGTVICNMSNIQIGGTVGARGIRAGGSIGHGMFIDGLLIQGLAAGAIGVDLGPLNSGSVIQNFSIQGGAVSIKANPGAGAINETTLANGIFDSYTAAGLLLESGGLGGVGNGWVVSNIRAAGVGGSNVGFDIRSEFRQITISNITGGGVGGGLVCRGCKNLTVSNFLWSGDGTGAAGNIAIDVQPDGGVASDGLIIQDSVLGYSDGGTTASNTSTIGIRISADAHTGLNIKGNRIYGSAAVLSDGSTGSGRYEQNTGIDDVLFNIASAGSVTAANGYRVFNVSGTTTINTILPGTGGWIGRQIQLIKTDAGSVPLGTAGNIKGAALLPQNGALFLHFDGTYWHPAPDFMAGVVLNGGDPAIDGSRLGGAMNVRGSSSANGNIVLHPGDVAGNASVVIEQARTDRQTLILKDKAGVTTTDALEFWDSANNPYFAIVPMGDAVQPGRVITKTIVPLVAGTEEVGTPTRRFSKFSGDILDMTGPGALLSLVLSTTLLVGTDANIVGGLGVGGTVDAGAYKVGGVSGISRTFTMIKTVNFGASSTTTCTIIVTLGIVTGGTC